jgi:hypothetical protein
MPSVVLLLTSGTNQPALKAGNCVAMSRSSAISKLVIVVPQLLYPATFTPSATHLHRDRLTRYARHPVNSPNFSCKILSAFLFAFLIVSMVGGSTLISPSSVNTTCTSSCPSTCFIWANQRRTLGKGAKSGGVLDMVMTVRKLLIFRTLEGVYPHLEHHHRIEGSRNGRRTAFPA